MNKKSKIDLDNYQKYTEAKEKLIQLQSKSRELKNKRKELEQDLYEARNLTESSFADQLLTQGQVDEVRAGNIENQMHELDFQIRVHKAAVLKQKKILESEIKKMRADIREDFKNEYSKLIKRWVSAVCETAEAEKEIIEFCRSFTEVEPDLSGIFDVPKYRGNFRLSSKNEPLRFRLQKFIDNGLIKPSDVSTLVSKTLNLKT